MDFIEFQDELNIEKACISLTKPNLVIHGDKDTSVSIEEGVEIATWTNSPLYTIENTDHVFGSSHPWNSNELPEITAVGKNNTAGKLDAIGKQPSIKVQILTYLPRLILQFNHLFNHE